MGRLAHGAVRDLNARTRDAGRGARRDERHHRAEAPRRSASPIAEDGCDRPIGGRHHARLQQLSDRAHRLHRAGAQAGRRRRDGVSGSEKRPAGSAQHRPPRRGPHPAAPDLQPQPGARTRAGRRLRWRAGAARRHASAAARRERSRSHIIAKRRHSCPHRSEAPRAGRREPRDERARRHAARRRADDRDVGRSS